MTQPFRVIREYRDLVNAMIDQRLALGMSCPDVDARAGFHENYTNKLENWDKAYGRGLGPITMPLWLESLGLALVVVRVDKLALPSRLQSDGQLSLDLIGGRMNSGIERKGFRRVKSPSLVDLAA